MLPKSDRELSDDCGRLKRQNVVVEEDFRGTAKNNIDFNILDNLFSKVDTGS